MSKLNSVFDCNIHSPNEDGWLQKDFESMKNNMISQNVAGGNLIYFPKPKQIPIDEVISMCKLNGYFDVIRVVDPVNEDVERVVEDSLSKGVIGFKLHPRIHEFQLNDERIFKVCEMIEDANVPLLICSFFDGGWSSYKLESNQFFDLAQKFPDQTFVWMHAGGPKVTEFTFMAKRNQNVYLDTSFTQNYFKFGIVPSEMAYGFYTTQGQKWIFGSDYPNFSFDAARTALMQIIETIPTEHAVIDLEQRIFVENARHVFPKHRFFESSPK